MDRYRLIDTLTEVIRQIRLDLGKKYFKAEDIPLRKFIKPEGNREGWRKAEVWLLDWHFILDKAYSFGGHTFPDQSALENFLKETDYFGGNEATALHFGTIVRIVSSIFSQVTDPIFGDFSNLASHIEKEIDQVLTRKKPVKVLVMIGNVKVHASVRLGSHSLFSPTWEQKVQVYLEAQRNLHFASMEEFSYFGDEILRCHSFIEFIFDIATSENHVPGKDNGEALTNFINAFRFLSPEPVSIVGKLLGINDNFYSPIFFAESDGFTPNEPIIIDLPNLAKDLEAFHKLDLDKSGLLFINDRVQQLAKSPRSIPHQVFDLISICEAIVAGNNEGEFRFKVPLHMVNLTNALNDKMEKKKRYALFKKCYDLRSKVAHCSKIEGKDIISQEELDHLKQTTFSLRNMLLTDRLEVIRERAIMLALN